MNNTKLKVQKCGSRWRIIIDGTKAEPVLIDFSTPYEELKRELGISNRQSEKSRRENGPMGFGEKPQPRSHGEAAVQSEYDSLWTHGVTNGELRWVNQEHSIAWIWTTREKLYAGLVNQSMAFLLQNSSVTSKGLKGGLLPIAEDMAKDKFDNLELVPDFKDYKAPKVDIINLEHTLALGSISAERPDDNGTRLNGSVSTGDKAAASAKKWAQGTVPELS